MINKALTFVEEQANLYMTGLLGPSTQKYVSLGNIANIVDSGDTNGNSNTFGVFITLVNIEEDRISKNPDGVFRNGDQVMRSNPPVLLNLYVLLTAYASLYTTALSRISSIIKCFQSTNYFTQATHPSLDPAIQKIHLELYTMNFEQVNHLWSTLGGKYHPSVLYKIRMIAIQDEENQAGQGLITEIQKRSEVIKPLS